MAGHLAGLGLAYGVGWWCGGPPCRPSHLAGLGLVGWAGGVAVHLAGLGFSEAGTLGRLIAVNGRLPSDGWSPRTLLIFCSVEGHPQRLTPRLQHPKPREQPGAHRGGAGSLGRWGIHTPALTPPDLSSIDTSVISEASIAYVASDPSLAAITLVMLKKGAAAHLTALLPLGPAVQKTCAPSAHALLLPQAKGKRGAFA